MSDRPEAPAVLTAIGLAVVFAGLGLLFALRFDELSHVEQMLTPFAFPLLALALAVALARSGRPTWQVEAAGLIGQGALVAAFVVVERVLAPADPSTFGAMCGLVGTIEVLVCHRLIGSVRLTGWGLSASLVALLNFGADAASSGDGGLGLGGLLLAEAALAAVLAGVLPGRRNEFGAHAARTASLLAYGAAVAGQEMHDWNAFSVWHVVISVAVVLTFLAAALLRLDALIWVGALGGLVWLVMVSEVVGSNSGGAGIVVLAGAGLTALGMLVSALRRVTRPHRPQPL